MDVSTKKRRLLTDSELFSIVESNEDELLAAEARLGDIASQVMDGIYQPGAYQRLVRDGKLEASTVRIGRKTAFVLIHGRNHLGWLVIEAVAALGRHPLKTLFNSVDSIASHFRAPAILWVTRISALYRYGLEQDYKSLGVIMWKGASS